MTSERGSVDADREVDRISDRRLVPWFVWLVAFYGVWAALQIGLGLWPETRAHWPIAAAMGLGSYVAGSTPMGGGTVGFPVLVLFFELPASLGRNFALVIQSIGMTSASIFILCRRSPIETRMLRASIVGSAVGLLVGTFVVVPIIDDATVKLIFACLWASFGLLTLVRNRELCALDEVPVVPWPAAIRLGLLVGVLGGITTALTGVGIDMMLYTVLVLLYRMDLKAAVPTSVIIMAISSLMGVALHVAIGDLDREVFHNWLAAAPVVILGAPLGAFLVSVISRVKTLYFVAVLCLLQFAWALYQVRPSAGQWILVVANLVLATAGFIVLHRVGKRLAARRAD
ncbi:MAG: sulfite exporter TauE/SafE family protein [Sandaracinaceae bacterium]